MMPVVLVGLGGAVGAVARWALSGLVVQLTPGWRFPLGTFAVNVIGCAIAGVLAGLVAKLDWFSADARLLLLTGLLGGFTTFSAFGLETVLLVRRGEYAVAAAYVALSVVGGVLTLWAGMALVPGRASP